MLQSPDPVDIRLWTHSGEIQFFSNTFSRHGKVQVNLTLLIWLTKTFWHRCVSLRYDFYKGTRHMKLLDSNEIRTLRDACVFEINGMEVFM